jgi:hypothetical protein
VLNEILSPADSVWNWIFLDLEVSQKQRFKSAFRTPLDPYHGF